MVFENPVFSMALGLIITAIVVYVTLIFNGLISLKNNIRKSSANIDVLLKQRSDELPRLVETVKGYMKHEKDVFATIARARAEMLKAQNLSQKAEASNEITEALKTIFALSEKYPELKANENFLKLQERITGLENEIADRREFYNDSVNAYNTRIQLFPDVIIAKAAGYTEPEQYFKATDEEKRTVAIGPIE